MPVQQRLREDGVALHDDGARPRRRARGCGGPARHPRPSRADLPSAAGARIPDLVRPGLRVLFVGINPGLWSGAVGHHFARPGNRFWPTLQRAGFTARVLSPCDQARLLDLGVGITNLVARTTASAAELDAHELVRGGRRLRAVVRRHRPAWVAFLGLGAYRTAFGMPRAGVGPQAHRLAGVRVWLLPNPSGLNAHWQRDALAGAFAALRRAARVPRARPAR